MKHIDLYPKKHNSYRSEKRAGNLGLIDLTWYSDILMPTSH